MHGHILVILYTSDTYVTPVNVDGHTTTCYNYQARGIAKTHVSSFRNKLHGLAYLYRLRLEYLIT